MNKIIYNLVYNRKKCLNKKGMALVQVEAYLGRKKKYFSTKVYLKPEQWELAVVASTRFRPRDNWTSAHARKLSFANIVAVS